MKELLLAGPSGLRASRRAIGGADELRVAATAASAAPDQDTLTLFREIREQLYFAVALLVHERAERHRYVEIVGGLSGPV